MYGNKIFEKYATVVKVLFFFPFCGMQNENMAAARSLFSFRFYGDN